jgi:hypothetical protein
VINAYVRPIVERYLSRLIGEVARIGIDVPLLLMQSNGGLTTAKAAALTPMHIIESGPAAGVVGVQALMRRIGIADLVRYGRYHREGVADREWRGDPRCRVPGRRRHRARLAALVRCRLYAEGAGDRPARRPARSPTTKAAPNRPSPTPIWCSAI